MGGNDGQTRASGGSCSKRRSGACGEGHRLQGFIPGIKAGVLATQVAAFAADRGTGRLRGRHHRQRLLMPAQRLYYQLPIMAARTDIDDLYRQRAVGSALSAISHGRKNSSTGP